MLSDSEIDWVNNIDVLLELYSEERVATILQLQPPTSASTSTQTTSTPTNASAPSNTGLIIGILVAIIAITVLMLLVVLGVIIIQHSRRQVRRYEELCNLPT